MRDNEMSVWNGVKDSAFIQDRLVMIPAELFDKIKNGSHKSIIEKIRAEKDKDKRNILKQSLPAVTVSGTFKERKISGLINHSGLICLDFDKVDNLSSIRESMSRDSCVFMCFSSASGSGLAVVVKIEPHRHAEAYEALSKRFYEKYGIVADVGCKDISRLRFLSYDPDVRYNSASELFNKIPKAEKPKKQYPVVPVTNTDIGKVVKQAADSRMDITDGSYSEWMRLGASLVYLGETGRQFYHALSCNHPKYRPEQTDKMFDNLMRTANGSITIGTFYYYAKRANLDCNTEKQVKIKDKCLEVRNSRDKTVVDAIDSLSDAGIICLPEDGEFAAKEDIELVKRVYEETKEGDSAGIQEIETYIFDRWKFRRNEIKINIEWVDSGIALEDKDYSYIYLETKKQYSSVKKSDVVDIIESKSESYNPLKEFIENHRDYITEGRVSGTIRELTDCFVSPSGMDGEVFDTDYEYHYIKKWFIGMIASIYGHVSPLLLALVGKQNSGKTRLLRSILPEGLKKYCAEIKLGMDKDSAMEMARNLIIIDDELSGKSRMEEKHLKELTSRDIMTFRPPYGRVSVQRKRLAVLCGTTNDEAILNDPTGNRRIIPVKIEELKFEELNKIDRIALFMEAVQLYESGESWDLTQEEIKRLDKNTVEYVQESLEKELIQTHYGIPVGGEGRFMPVSQMLADLEAEHNSRISIKKLGMELRVSKFDSVLKRIDGKVMRGYVVVPRNFTIPLKNYIY